MPDFQQTESRLSAVTAWLRENLALLLLLLTLFLFVSKSLYNFPVVIMAFLGLWRTIQTRGRILTDPIIFNYTLLFLCIWLPLLFSLVDAANPGRSSSTVFPYLRFLFMGVYILQERARLLLLLPQLRLATFYVASFWAIDGCIQYLAGINLVGYPYEPGHITGMFYPRNTIAHILAALSPLYFDSLRIYSKRYKWLWLFILPLIAVILLSGRRAAWIMLTISIAGYVFYLFRFTVTTRGFRRNLTLIIMTALTTIVLVIISNKPLQDRITTTAGLFSLEYETMDIATAQRLPIWETAIEVFRHNWINGVGPRGFRYVYQQYSTEDNFWYETPATHPHQLLLEVLTETGLIGLTGLIIFVWLFCRYFLVHPHLTRVYPLILSVLIIMFPFSSNLAFYSSYWSSVIWWFLLVTFITFKVSQEKNGA